jgi:hypothetical protein
VVNLIFHVYRYSIMGVHRDPGQLHIQGGFPYQEALLMEDIYNSYEQMICPRCGSIHQTTFTNLVSNQAEGDTLSGDLKFKRLIIGKCLSCGLERPVKFQCIREA